MANTIQKIFKMIINFGDSEERIPRINKLLQSFHVRLQNILKTINEIGSSDGLKKTSEALKIYDLTIKAVDKSKAKITVSTKSESAALIEQQKFVSSLNTTYGKLYFTKRDQATLINSHKILLYGEKSSVEALQAQVNVLNIAWKKMSTTRRNSTQGKQVTADLKAMREELRRLTMGAGDTSRNVGNYMSAIYNKITGVVTTTTAVLYTFRRVINGLFEPFQDLEYRLSMVKAVSRATDEQFILLTHNARLLGATTEYTATEVAGLQLTYARLGFVPEQIIKITSATLDLATATGENLAKSADVVGITLRGFNLQADQTQRVVDVMTESFNASSLQLDYFYEAMKYVAPIANASNVSLEQTAAMLGVLADRGIRGSQAGTSLRRILTEIAKEGGTVSERLEELNKRGLTVTGAMDEVGRYAMTAMKVLVDAKGSVDDLTYSLHNAEGAAKTAADIMRDNMWGDVKIFLSAVQEKLIGVGESLSPLAREVIQMGTSFVSSLKEISLAILTGAAAVYTWNLYIKAKIAWQNLASLSDRASAFATALNTASLSGNTTMMMRNIVAMRSASAITKAYAIVKLLLAGNIKAATVATKAFTVALAKNPLGLLAVALASVVSYFVFFREEADSATDAQKRFNDETERFNKLQDEKRQRIDELIRIIKDETETEYAKIAAYNELEQLSPSLTDKYNQEQIATMELAEASKVLNEQRDKENYDKLVTNVDKHTASIKKLREEVEKSDEIKKDFKKNKKLSPTARILKTEEIAKLETELAEYKRLLADAVKIREEAAQKLEPIKVQIAIAEANVAQISKAYEDADAEYQKFRNKWIEEHGGTVGMPLTFYFNAQQLRNELTAGKKTVEELKNQDRNTPIANPDGKDDKVEEWSLSNDKNHNTQLLELKRQLHSNEITSEEQYQKRVLQLEIDTLTKRITLNKDASKTILKLKNELADKQYQQTKASKKDDENYANNRKAQDEKILKYKNDCIDAEIDAMDDGLEKQILAHEHSIKKNQESAQKEFESSIETLEKQQSTYVKDSKEYNAIESEKSELTQLYDSKNTAIKISGVNARKNIFQKATIEELNTITKLPIYAAEAEKAITDNKRKELAKRKKATDDAIKGAEIDYSVGKDVADSRGTKGEKKEANLQNEIALRNAKAQAYMLELTEIQSLGQEDSARYGEVLHNLSLIKTETMNLANGLNTDGSGGGVKGWLMRTFEITPEQFNQLKNQAFDLASQIGDAMVTAQKRSSERRLKNEKKTIDAEYKVYTKLLDSKRDKGLISESKYQEKLEELEAQKAAKEEETERAAFEREKKLNIQAAIMNTAIAVMRIWADVPKFDFGISTAIMTALAIAQGAVQIGIISSQKFAQGGIIPIDKKTAVVKGRSHADGGHQIYLDGTPIGEVEGDELIAIVNKQDTARIGALSNINSVHGRKFAQGGIMTSNVSAPPAFHSTSTSQNYVGYSQFVEMTTLIKESIDATNSRIDKIKVVVLAQEMTEVQENLEKIKARATF